MGGTILSIDGYFFYSDDGLPAKIQVGGKKNWIFCFACLD